MLLFFLCFTCSAQNKYLETIKITDSIYVFKPKIDWSHGNGVAIIGKDGIFFIDTYIQMNYAEEAIQLLKKITKLPVKFVLNTHYHNDHVIGNYAFVKAYPACQIIAHDSTYAYMNKSIKNYIEKEPEIIEQFLADTKTERKTGKRKTSGLSLTDKMKIFWDLQIREGEEYKKSLKQNKFVNASITFNDSLTFHWGSYTLQLIHLPEKGHSPGDVIVWIPEKKLVITGDIIVAPTPYATFINIPGMMTSIQRIMNMTPAVIIPGHGHVQYNLDYVKLQQEAFHTYYNAALKAIADSVPVKDAMANIQFKTLDEKFTAGDDLINWAYRSFFVRNLIYNVYKLQGVTK